MVNPKVTEPRTNLSGTLGPSQRFAEFCECPNPGSPSAAYTSPVRQLRSLQEARLWQMQ
jgi:hypothetical protein